MSPAFLFRTLAVFPSCALSDAGVSLRGHPLRCVTLGCGDKRVAYIGCLHGSEWISAAVLVRFALELHTAAQTGKSLAGRDAARALRLCRLCILPMANPDGVELSLYGPSKNDEDYDELIKMNGGTDFTHWQANRRGVDLNHNFDAGFDLGRGYELIGGTALPGPTRHGGPHPFSEPESAALRDLVAGGFSRLYAFHSQGEEIYQGFDGYLPPGSQRVAQALAAAAGYRLSAPSGMAALRGLKDWFVAAFDRPGFTVELGRGENPLPPAAFEGVYARVLPLLMLGLEL